MNSSASRSNLPGVATVFSRILSCPAMVDRRIRAVWKMVEDTYPTLPDWAQPILWGLGLSVPVAVVALGIWTVANL